MSASAEMVKRPWRKIRPNGKMIFYAVLIVIQAVAAAFAAVKTNQGTSPVFTVILLALIVTIAAGVREFVRDITGPEHKAGREVVKSHHLLMFMSERFPALMNLLTGVSIAKTAKGRSENASALQHRVLTETSQLIPDVVLRVAIFWVNGNHFRASPDCPGWQEKPVCPGKGIDVVIRETLKDETCLRAYSEDVDTEKSARALAFRFSDTCQSFVAVPIRSPHGLAGFLHVECDEKRVLDQRVAAVIVAISQLLSAAVTLERQLQPLPKQPA